MKSLVTAAMVVACVAGAANAAPTINGAVINSRVFNDYPASNHTFNNNYSTNVQLADGNLLGPGFANLHNFRLSDNGGASAAVFNNADPFAIWANVTVSTTGNGAGEAGLTVSPWFSQNVDGVFNIRTTDGEVAVFGGRLPFFSFTGAFGVQYVAGTTVNVGIEYDPRSLTMADPGQIRYTYNGFSSGWLNFDQGNPAEDPPYGLWGTLNDARVGGRLLAFGGRTGTVTADFGNIYYAVPAPSASIALGLFGLAATRRRR
jgi:hypothetical protein